MPTLSTPPFSAIFLGCTLLVGIGCQRKEAPEPAATVVTTPTDTKAEAKVDTEIHAKVPTKVEAEPEAEPEQDGYSPYAGREHPTKVFWGDTHVHTSNSLDARAFGVTLGPEEAYRFARGEEVTATHGQKVKLARPLDWLVVADHSDGIGAMSEIIAGNPKLLADPTLADWNERINAGGETALMATMDVIQAFAQGRIPRPLEDEAFTRTVWDRYLETAEKYNEPGRFTTIFGYEWTSTKGGDNLHRNVLYRDGAALARRMLPFTASQSFDPEALWAWMQRYENETGGKVLALAHNGNLSNGLMFPVEINPATGKLLTGDYARDRARWEPLYEVTQIKGDGETHPALSPTDEFADYERWDRGNLTLSVLKTEDMLQYEYARRALENGLALEASLGTNPYKFGMVGSTDAHTALSTAEEDNFFGKHSGNEPNPNRAESVVAEMHHRRVMGWKMVASGYAAVWARENTRDSLFDAMMRKEVYATTGPRITVRFFGGWTFEDADANTRMPADTGYAKGVPMGGDLTVPPSPGAAPSFLIAALKDPLGGNLDRIQIIKGWLGEGDQIHEEIYDVVWSDADARKPDAAGKLPPVGSTVDVANATWTNTIGDPELITVWKDPDFDPEQRAFYYARVIEIPTPRWTAYDAKRMGTKMGEDVPMTTQERAYTSPIWYSP